MTTAAWSLVSIGLMCALSGKWLAYSGRVPPDRQDDTITRGWHLAARLVIRGGLIAAAAGFALLVASAIA